MLLRFVDLLRNVVLETSSKANEKIVVSKKETDKEKLVSNGQSKESKPIASASITEVKAKAEVKIEQTVDNDEDDDEPVWQVKKSENLSSRACPYLDTIER